MTGAGPCYDLGEWLLESYRHAMELAYRELPGFSCSKDAPDKVKVTPGYVKEAVPLVRRRLAMAGARIAYVLERAFPN